MDGYGRLLAGDTLLPKDLKQLFLAHRKELQAYLTRRLRDSEVASDLTQETFLRFAEQQGNVAIIHDRSYLFKTARNLAIDHIRSIGTRKTDATAHEDIAHIPEDQPSPEAEVDSRQRLGLLHAILAELPERTREAFVLNRFQGMTYAEIARYMGVSDSTVQKHIAQALEYAAIRLNGM